MGKSPFDLTDIKSRNLGRSQQVDLATQDVHKDEEPLKLPDSEVARIAAMSRPEQLRAMDLMQQAAHRMRMMIGSGKSIGKSVNGVMVPADLPDMKRTLRLIETQALHVFDVLVIGANRARLELARDEMRKVVEASPESGDLAELDEREIPTEMIDRGTLEGTRFEPQPDEPSSLAFVDEDTVDDSAPPASTDSIDHP